MNAVNGHDKHVAYTRTCVSWDRSSVSGEVKILDLDDNRQSPIDVTAMISHDNTLLLTSLEVESESDAKIILRYFRQKDQRWRNI